MKGRKRKKIKLLLFSIAPLATVGLAAFLMYFSDRLYGVTESFWDILERIIIVLMGEYPDQPITILGRIIQVLLLVSSTVLMGAIVGKISSVFVAKSLLQRDKMKKYKHFVVVCNWNTKAPGIVSELLRADEALNVVVVHTGAVNLDTHFKEEERDRLSFHQADPMNYEVLREIRIPDAKSVILLADASVENPDDKNALIALAIKHLEKETTDVHVVVELVHTNRRKHLLDAGADEVICSTDYTAGIIAQSAIYNRMSEVYERLLSYSANTNEIYFVSKYPSSFIGKPFLDLIPEVSQRSDEQKSPFLLIGIKRKEKIFLNPKSERFSVLEENDELIVMSYDRVEQIV